MSEKEPATTLTHLNAKGQANMVDVGNKAVTQRIARAETYVSMQKTTLELIEHGMHKKGDVISVARVAGIQAAKKCADLIPLCHPLLLSKIGVEIAIESEHKRVRIESECRLQGKTGVEMEALTAASVAALTVYDMCKAVDRHMVIGPTKVLQKSGGKSGSWLEPSDSES